MNVLTGLALPESDSRHLFTIFASKPVTCDSFKHGLEEHESRNLKTDQQCLALLQVNNIITHRKTWGPTEKNNPPTKGATKMMHRTECTAARRVLTAVVLLLAIILNVEVADALDIPKALQDQLHNVLLLCIFFFFPRFMFAMSAKWSRYRACLKFPRLTTSPGGSVPHVENSQTELEQGQGDCHSHQHPLLQQVRSSFVCAQHTCSNTHALTHGL